MTRNEFISTTAAQVFCSIDGLLDDTVYEGCVENAVRIADSIEAAGCAPWIDDESPALTDTAAKVVEAAEPFIESLGHALFTPEGITLRDAVRAHLAAKQGGAK